MSERASTKGRDDELASASYPQEPIPDSVRRRRIAHIRALRFQQQGGLCFYCALPMWAPWLETADQARARFGIVKGAANSARMLRRIQCTAEHLHRRTDGGEDNPSNLTAAHRWCNKVRGETPYEEYREIRTADPGKMAFIGSGQSLADATPNPLSEGRERS